MNQLFAVKPSGRVARKLRQLSTVTNASIDEKILALVDQDLIPDSAFDQLPLFSSESIRSTVQQIVDNCFRCVLVADKLDAVRMAAISAIHIEQRRPLIICTNTPGQWNLLLRRFGIKASDDIQSTAEALLIPRQRIAEPGVLDNRLHGTLIIEFTEPEGLTADAGIGVSKKLTGPAREVAQTIILCQVGRQLIPTMGWGARSQDRINAAVKILFPDGLDAFVSEQLVGFTENKPACLYFMLNVITDLLGYDVDEVRQAIENGMRQAIESGHARESQNNCFAVTL